MAVGKKYVSLNAVNKVKSRAGTKVSVHEISLSLKPENRSVTDTRIHFVTICKVVNIRSDRSILKIHKTI